MQFLADVYLRCGECGGSRYRAETLKVRLEGAGGQRADIAAVLELTVTEAPFPSPARARLLAACNRSRMSVWTTCALGQPVPTLSRAAKPKRLKLAGYLAAPPRRRGPDHARRARR
jgi:excinuclease ABC subunit A